MTSMRTPMARVRGLGAAKDGTGHWWGQRLSALAMIPLVVWFVASIISMAGADYTTMQVWVGSPVVAGLLILLIAATFYHAHLGLQAVVEDYVHNEATKFTALIAIKALAIVLSLTGILAVLSILFRG